MGQYSDVSVSDLDITNGKQIIRDDYTVKETVPAVTRTPQGSDGSLPSSSTKQAPLTQLVEYSTVYWEVRGSSPLRRANFV